MNPIASPAPRISLVKLVADVPRRPTARSSLAPSASVRDGSGTTGSRVDLHPGAQPRCGPGRRPHGELNEHEARLQLIRTTGRRTGRPGARRTSARRCGSSSSRSTKSITTTPPDSASAVSTESVSLRRASGLTASRSITTSMSCFSYFFSTGSRPEAASSSRTTTPSTRARENPLACSSRISSPYSPLRPRTTHRGQHLEPVARPRPRAARSTICCGLCSRRSAARTQGSAACRSRACSSRQVVVDLGDRPDGGARVAAGRLLVDPEATAGDSPSMKSTIAACPSGRGSCRAYADSDSTLAPLALGEDGVEEPGWTSPDPDKAGEDDHGIPRQVQRDILEVVLTGTANHKTISHSVLSSPR